MKKSLDKKDLRQTLRLKRSNLANLVTSSSSIKIFEKLQKLIHFENIDSLHTYVSISKDNEIDTLELMHYVWRNHPHLHTVVPRLNSKGGYDSVLVNKQTKWKTNGVRIPEPIDSEILTNNAQFDVIIVPMLGFDDSGHRLGHGLGWYDRFLVAQLQALAIGLSYEFGLIIPGLPHEPHDVPLKYIVTEKTVRKF